MRTDYRNWLEEQKYDTNTITAQLHRAGRVEECYGDLDRHFAEGTLQVIIDELTYTAEDERRNMRIRQIPFRGNTRNNLASYKNAVVRYRKFLTGGWDRSDVDAPAPVIVAGRPQPADDQAAMPGQKLALERDMQAALRRNIQQLGGTLSIIDDGAERSVVSGLIDITCLDNKDGALVVVELKAGKADSRAIGQILGYMGDLAEEDGKIVRGILVAHEFDKRMRSAAKVVSALSLMRYSVDFHFEREE